MQNIRIAPDVGALSPRDAGDWGARRRRRACVCAPLACAASLWLCAPGRGDTLVAYTFEGDVLTPSTTHVRVAATDFSYQGADATPGFFAGADSADAYSASDWQVGHGLGAYYTFALTIGAGFVGEISAVTFDSERSDTGPTNWVVRFSTDGAAFHTMGAWESTTSFGDEVADDCHLPRVVGTVWFRMYGTNASSDQGTWRVDNVTVSGTLAIDDGSRIIRFQGFDAGPYDTWASSTNAGSGTVAVSDDEHYRGARSLKLTGSINGLSDPCVTFDSVSVSGYSNVAVAVAFAAAGPDADDDLYLDLSFDGGSTWPAVTKLVDGYDGANIAFGATHTVAPVTVSANPYRTTISADQADVAIQLRFQETSNGHLDSYYLDSLILTGIPIPSSNAPSIANYGIPAELTVASATIQGHVRGGYPYPSITVYYGPTDGGDVFGQWRHATNIGAKAWGLFSYTLGGLRPGQCYYYRLYASNVRGSALADTSTGFVTAAGAMPASARAYIDSFAVGTGMPWAIDRDGDGLSDAWEIEHFTNIGSTDGSVDSDSDEVTDELEYLAGTDPDDASSKMQIEGVGPATADSNDIRLRIRGGGFSGPARYTTAGDAIARTFRIYAGGSASAPKALVGEVTDGDTGTNYWTDPGAAGVYRSRFYEVATVYGGGAYTNTETWAMFAQPRVARHATLVCVPVDYGAGNNLNAALGDELARGLHASDTEAEADKVRWRDADNAWVEYFLSASGGWSKAGEPGASVAIEPGKALWIVRGSGSVSRTNAVFGGKVFAASDLSPRNFKANAWTAAGWPLPTPGAASGADTTPNQLGFTEGNGGTRGELYDARSGDQLWVWRYEGGWDRYWLTDDHDGEVDPLDRRWYKSYGVDRGFADIAIEPGQALYYFHSTNWGGASDFDWKPE